MEGGKKAEKRREEEETDGDSPVRTHIRQITRQADRERNTPALEKKMVDLVS
jgi:hypothetical protein